MERNKFRLGDCILMRGETINKPMTLYHIINVTDEKVEALSIYVHEKQVQGLDFPSEYDNEIPADAIMLPDGTYNRVKSEMRQFLDEIGDYLKTHCLQENFQVRVGGHYLDRHIETITSIEGNKTKYELFRLEEENISPSWTGEGFVDGLESRGIEVPDNVFNEVMLRYNQFVKKLKNSLWK